MRQNNFFKYLLSRIPLYLFVSVVAVIIYQLIAEKWILKNDTTDVINLITMLTFIAAIFIGILELREEYESNLPKLLTVQFLLQDKIIYECQNAPLAHEGDIRNWAQQIGKQMNNDKDLPLDPRFNVIEDKKPKQVSGIRYKHYLVIYKFRNSATIGPGFGEINPEAKEKSDDGAPKKWDLLSGKLSL